MRSYGRMMYASRARAPTRRIHTRKNLAGHLARRERSPDRARRRARKVEDPASTPRRSLMRKAGSTINSLSRSARTSGLNRARIVYAATPPRRRYNFAASASFFVRKRIFLSGNRQPRRPPVWRNLFRSGFSSRRGSSLPGKQSKFVRARLCPSET